MAAFPPRPDHVPAVLRGFSLRCPRCGQGKLADGLFKRRPYCTVCGQDFRLKEGEFTGGAYIGYGLSIAVLGLLFAILVGPLRMDIEQTLWILLPGGVLVPVLLHRHAVGAFTGVLVASGAMDEQAPERR